MRIHERLNESGSMLAPPLNELGTHFQKAIGPLQGRERLKVGLDLARERIAFLQGRMKSKPGDPYLLEGVATFSELSAVLYAEEDDIEGGRKALVVAEEARRNVVGSYAKRSDPRASGARTQWAMTLANLAGATYHAAIRAYEKHNGQTPSRESTLANVKEAAELGNRAMEQFEITLSQQRELSAAAAQSASVLRTTTALITGSIEELGEE